MELQRFFAKHACDPNAVDDLVQVVYVRLLKYTKDARIRDSHAYIFQVARNVLKDANRRTKVDRERVISCDPLTLEQFAADQGLDCRVADSSAEVSERSELIRVFKRLPRTAQEAWLHQREGLSYRQIAAQMHVSEHAVKKYISTALQGIREYFKRQRSGSTGSPK